MSAETKEYSEYKQKRERARKAHEANLNKIFKVYPKVDWLNLEFLYAQFLHNYKRDNINQVMAYDETYRIYHGSFKMYRMTEDTLSMWNLLFKVFKFKTIDAQKLEHEMLLERVEEKPKEGFANMEYFDKEGNKIEHNELVSIRKEIAKSVFEKQYKMFISNLKKLGACELLLKQVRTIKNTRFTLDKNNNGDWMKDSLNMKAVLEISRELVESTFAFLYEEYMKEGEFYDKAKGTLSSPKALMMETLFALTFRYGSRIRDEEKMVQLKKKVREDIEKAHSNRLNKDFENFYTVLLYEIDALGKSGEIIMSPKFSTYEINSKEYFYERAQIRFNNSEDSKERALKILDYGMVDYSREEKDRNMFVTVSSKTRYRR